VPGHRRNADVRRREKLRLRGGDPHFLQRGKIKAHAVIQWFFGKHQRMAELFGEFPGGRTQAPRQFRQPCRIRRESRLP
jgi:hypothetical protein